MKTQAWDVLLKVKNESRGGISHSHQDSVVRVRLPFTTVNARLIRNSMGYDFYYVDTVFFDADMDRRQVRKSLIEHDGYPSNIVVER